MLARLKLALKLDRWRRRLHFLVSLQFAARDDLPRQDSVADRAVLLHMQVAAVRRLERLLQVLERPTALLLQCLCLKQVVLLVAVGLSHPHGRVRLFKLVELLADFDLGGGWHGFR